MGTVPVETDNWQPKLEKLEKSLNLWKSRSLSFVGRALMVNVLRFSKLLFLSHFFIVPASVFARVNKLVWGFIWGSRIETVGRNALSLSSRFGGLGICNFKLKWNALLRSLVVCTVICPDDPSFFFCRYFKGCRLASTRAEWARLRDVSAPSAASPTPFYASVLQILSRLSDLSNFSSRGIYLRLLDDVASPPTLPVQWSRFVPVDFSLKRHWSLVRDGFSENFKDDLSWLITLRGAKVRNSLRDWGYINSPSCTSCPRQETIAHFFCIGPVFKECGPISFPFSLLFLAAL